jgi:oligopeptide/dipeptide ABC transporter ATP-binding protein
VSRPVVELRDVEVTFRGGGSLLQRRPPVVAVNGVTLSVDPRETLGLVGESGSGKSTVARAALGLVAVTRGSVHLKGENLAELSPKRKRAIRRHAQMIFQDPYSSLDPTMQVRDIIGEPLEVHQGHRGRERDQRVRELLEEVGLSGDVAHRYPHEFSGGQRQRIAIARAVALRPELIVCDEASSALDVSVRRQILSLLEHLRESFGVAYLFIGHDLATVRRISHRVAVMYLGTIVEEGPAERVYSHPRHPYTQALLSAVPQPVARRRRTGRRIVLRGDAADPAHIPRGCPFHTRCPYVMDRCRTTEPPIVVADGGGIARCHLTELDT